MIGKQAMQAISERQNKAATLKDSIIVAAEGYNAVTKELARVEKEKSSKKVEREEEQKINVGDLKNAEKLVLDDIEGR